MMTSTRRILDTVVIGAGPAGLGTALALAAVDDLFFGVIERGAIGQTFLDWPVDQRFLTPSFTGNGFGATDLNAIHPDTSPAFSLGVDYPDGQGYATYLRSVAGHFKIPTLQQTTVTGVTKVDDVFDVTTTKGPLQARTVIWAGGEFHDRSVPPIPGAASLTHAADQQSWAARDGDLVIVGGYESGVDLACHHVAQGATVTVVDAASPWDARSGADPSFRLAPRSRIRFKEARATGRLHLVAADATAVVVEGGRFLVELADGTSVASDSAPINAVGYGPGLGPVRELFEIREDGWPLLDSDDQSTLAPGLFLAGAALRHDRLKFCFIYKFRQRFAHVAGVIGATLGKDIGALDLWRAAGMLTDDLACCGTDCAC
jgi:thioredoxin reductase